MPDPNEKPSPHETDLIIAFDEDDDGEVSIDVVQLDPDDD